MGRVLFCIMMCVVGFGRVVSAQEANESFVESYPEDVLSSLQEEAGSPYYGGIAANTKWKNASTIQVAFEDTITNQEITVGTQKMRVFDYVALVAREWSKYANLQFEFKDPSGVYHRWSKTDQAYKSLQSIRISFTPGGGYWSLLGTTSVNPKVRGPGAASMNLDLGQGSLPSGGRRHILHEFGHAIGLVHEHQRRGTRCRFRWISDRGYVKTFASDRGFLKRDSQNRRPGIIDYLKAKPFDWDCGRIISNLSTDLAPVESNGSDYDPDSIMLYTFPEYLLLDSNCVQKGNNNQDISRTDGTVAGQNYPYW